MPMRTMKMTALLMVAAAAVLVPLYGALRGGTVTHPDWARMLVRALEMEGGLPENAAPAQVFSALSWKGSLAFAADRYQRATGVALQASGGTPAAVATEAEGEIVYPLDRDHRWRLPRARAPGRQSRSAGGGGDRARRPGRPRRHRDARAVIDHGLGGRRRAPPRPRRLLGGGPAPRRRGAGDDRGGAARASPPSSRCADGRRTPSRTRWTWRPRWSRPIDKESELPPAAAPIEVSAESFQEESAQRWRSTGRARGAGGPARRAWPLSTCRRPASTPSPSTGSWAAARAGARTPAARRSCARPSTPRPPRRRSGAR